MQHIRILLLGVSFRLYISYEIPAPWNIYAYFNQRFHLGFTEVIKSRLAKKVEKIEKLEMAETLEVRRGFTFLTDFSKNLS